MRLPATHLRWLFLFFGLIAVSASVALPLWSRAQPASATCATPRSAADSIFQSGEICMAISKDKKSSRAAQLQRLLDARGLVVPVADLSDSPDFEPENGATHIILFPNRAPWVSLSKSSDGEWQYSSLTAEQVPSEYQSTFSSISLWLQDALPDSFNQRIQINESIPLGFGWQYVIAGLWLAAALGLGLVVRFFVLGQVRGILSRLSIRIDQKLLHKLDTPVMLLVSTGFLSWRLADVQLPVHVATTSFLVLSVVLGLSGVLIASRIVDIAAGVWEIQAEETESKLDDQLVPLVRQFSRIIVWAVGILFVLQNNGVQVWSFIAGLGIGSLAFALAAQDTVANLFGALNIFLDKPFQIGDFVKVDGVIGTVEEVGFRSFRVRTFNNALVTIPNSKITTTNVENLGVRPRRRASMTLGLMYGTPPATIEAFIEGVRLVLAAHPRVDEGSEVHLNEFGGSSIDIMVTYQIDTDSWSEELRTKQENMLEIIRLAEAMKVGFAFPSTSLYVEQTPQHPAPSPETPTLDALRQTAAQFGPDGVLSRFHAASSNEKDSPT